MQKNKTLFIEASVFLFILATIHFLAIYFSWYYAIYWLDIPVHFVAGFIATLFFGVYREDKDYQHFFISATLFTLVSAILWESLEFLSNFYFNATPNPLFDTIKDICITTLGGGAGYLRVKMKTN